MFLNSALLMIFTLLCLSSKKQQVKVSSSRLRANKSMQKCLCVQWDFVTAF